MNTRVIVILTVHVQRVMEKIKKCCSLSGLWAMRGSGAQAGSLGRVGKRQINRYATRPCHMSPKATGPRQGAMQ